jgi:hypothetical protein
MGLWLSGCVARHSSAEAGPANAADDHAMALRDASAPPAPGAMDAGGSARDAASIAQDPPAPDAGLAVQDASTPDATLVVQDASAPNDDRDSGMPDPKPTVTFDIVTKPLAGEGMSFAPRNILAIWVEDANARPVKVLCVLAGIMRTRLREFNQRFPMFFGGFAAAVTAHPDVVTSATRRDHQPVHVTWDLTDLNQQPVPDGLYRVLIELTDRNDRSALLAVPFDKNGRPAHVEMPESRDFGAAVLEYTP